MRDSAESLNTITVMGRRSRIMVSSSAATIMKPPSPVKQSTRCPGQTSWAAMAAGTAKPMVARPFEMRNSPGLTACQNSAAGNMCAPASTVAMVPVGVMAPEARRELLEDEAGNAHHLEGGAEVPAAGRCTDQAQHGRGVAPGARNQLHGVEAESDDEVGAADRRLLEGAAREHAEGEGMRIRECTLGLVGRKDGGRKRLREGP